MESFTSEKPEKRVALHALAALDLRHNGKVSVLHRGAGLLLTSVLRILDSVCYLRLRYAASPPWRLGGAERT